MNRTIRHKIVLVSVFCIALTALAFHMPMTCQGEDFTLTVEFSPNIINIESIRLGDIRILTNMRYSTYVARGDSIFIYFNDSETVQNIRPTRDSLGNLILRFAMEDLLALEEDLITDGFNNAEVVIVMKEEEEDGVVEYSATDEIFINAKKALKE